MSNLTLGELRAANVARDLEWSKGRKLPPSFRGNEFGGEVGEAVEIILDVMRLTAVSGKLQNTIKKLDRERMGIGGSKATLDQLSDELADVLISLDLIAMDFGIDLGFATAKKFNETSEKVGLTTKL